MLLFSATDIELVHWEDSQRYSFGTLTFRNNKHKQYLPHASTDRGIKNTVYRKTAEHKKYYRENW